MALGHKSLNLVQRKKETDRIMAENQAFAKRMFERESFLRKEDLDKDYAQHKIYLRQLKKLDLEKAHLRTPPKIKKIKRSKTVKPRSPRNKSMQVVSRAAIGVKPFTGESEVLF